MTEYPNPFATVLDCLEPREMAAVVLRHGLDGNGERTLECIGKVIGPVHRERVRQILGMAFRKLRSHLQLRAMIEPDVLDELRQADFRLCEGIALPQLPKLKKRRKQYRRLAPIPDSIVTESIRKLAEELHEKEWLEYRATSWWKAIIYQTDIVSPINRHGTQWMNACTVIGDYAYYKKGKTRQLLAPESKRPQVEKALSRRGYRHLIGSFWGIGQRRIIAIGKHQYGTARKIWINCVTL